jgi:Ca2+-binding RTX toxin-like protein
VANILVSSPLNMHNVTTSYGTVTSYDASELTITIGSLQVIYTGSFTYDGSGNVFGTLTGLEELLAGVPILTATGLNVSANLAEQLINSNQDQALFQTALAGNDQFTLQAGTHLIDGYGGYNTITESLAYSSYSVSKGGSSEIVTSAASSDTLYNIQGVYFADGFYDITNATFSPDTLASGFAAEDVTTGVAASGSPQAYGGPVVGIQKDYISVTSDNLNVSASSDNWFVHTGSGTDAIAVHGGTNVLDGGTGSNFLTGGSGTDTFFVDDRGPASDIWSTVNNFHSGDAATIWGVTPSDFALSWVDGQGATDYTGLTLHATAAGVPTASLTLAGFTSADLTDGKLTVSYGTTAASGGVPGSTYMYVHAT